MSSSTAAHSAVSFLGYTLDADDAQLRRGRDVVPLRPKTLAVLTHLIGNPGRLVTKAELLDAVWPDTAVSESVLTSCVKELRQALDDDPRQPRAIETAHRRGYRFIAAIESTAAPAAARPDAASRGREVHLLGRDADLGELESWLQAAIDGRRQMGFVIGEPGIGKTALVECFLKGIAGSKPAGENGVLIARGQCLELHGAGEAYLPVIDAIERLCAGRADLIDALRRRAPTWLLQLPALVDADEVGALERRVAGSSGARMPRELAAFIEALPAPLILFIEDLHWSDHATVDLLSILASRREAARLLVLGTYRPVDVVVRDHPLKRMNQQLRERDLCRDLWLQPLGEREVADYVGARWPGLDATRLARTLYEHTDGNPLFLVNVAEYLLATGAVARGDDGWTLQPAEPAVDRTVPLGLRQMIAAQLERVESKPREVLEAGSIAGRSFSAALVAAALERDVVEVEGELSRLAEGEHFVRATGTCQWPDGTVAGLYEITHFLYRSVLEDGVPPARAQQLHARLAERLEAAYGGRAEEIAAELAFHFERGGQAERAVPYLEASAARAVRRGAAREAVETLRHALSLLEAAPPSQTRAQSAISASIALGAALPALNGYVDSEIERAFLRARELSEEIGDRLRLFQSLIALTANYISRARLTDARDTAAAIEQLMDELSVPMLTFGGSLIVGMERFHAGSLGDARRHLERAAQLSGVPTPALSLDMVVLQLDYLALTLLHLGYPDQARAMCERAAARAAEVGRPFDRGSAAQIACFIFLMLRDYSALSRVAEAAIAEGAEHALPAIRAIGTVARGRVAVATGDHANGIATIRAGIEAYAESGQRIALPSTLVALASALLEAREGEQARASIAEAQELVESTGERRQAPELHRLAGEVHKLRGDGDRAERSFRRAVEIANAEGARWLELRAATDLARLWRDNGKRAAARKLLAPICEAFDEGEDTADLVAARALLSQLGGAGRIVNREP